MQIAHCIISILALAFAANGQADSTVFPPGSRVIGHRGLGANHWPEPENSVLALSLALRAGASAVEFDVQLTDDGQVVLAHDVKIDRMTTGKGCLAEKSFSELRGLWLRDGKGGQQPETVGTLVEALEAIQPFDDPRRAFLADIHIKVYDGFKGDWGGLFNDFCRKTRYAELTQKVLDEVRAKGLTERVLFTSFDRRVLNLIRKLEPRAKVGIISDFRTTHAIKKAIKAGYDAAAVEFQHIDPKEIELAHKNHVAVYAWSPAEEGDIEKLFATYQIDGVISNSVPNALQACERSCYMTLHE